MSLYLARRPFKPMAASPLAFDDFNRADGSLGTASDGHSVWSNVRGTFAVSSDQAIPATLGSLSISVAVVDVGVSDCTVSAVLSFNPAVASSLGVAFDVVDANNFYYTDASGVNLFLAGSNVAIGTFSPGPLLTGDTIQVTRSGSGIDCFRIRSGVTTAIGSFTQGSLSGTQQGLFAANSTAYSYDDFLVMP